MEEIEDLLRQVHNAQPLEVLEKLTKAIKSVQAAESVLKSEATLLAIIRLLSSEEAKVSSAAHGLLMAATSFPTAINTVTNLDQVVKYLHAIQESSPHAHTADITTRLTSQRHRSKSLRVPQNATHKRVLSNSLEFQMDRQNVEAFSILQQTQRFINNLKDAALASAEEKRNLLQSQLQDETEHDTQFVAQLEHSTKGVGMADMVRSSLSRTHTKKKLALERTLLEDANQEFDELLVHIEKQVHDMPVANDQLVALLQQIRSLIHVEKQNLFEQLRAGARANVHDVEEIKGKALVRAQVQSLRIRNNIIQQARARLKSFKEDYGDELAFALQHAIEEKDATFVLEEKRASRQEQVKSRLLNPAEAEWREFADEILAEFRDRMSGDDDDQDITTKLRAQLNFEEQDLNDKLKDIVDDCHEAMAGIEERCMIQDKLLREQDRAHQAALDNAKRQEIARSMQARGLRELEAQRLKMERQLLEREKQQHQEMVMKHREQMITEQKRLQARTSAFQFGTGALKFCAVGTVDPHQITGTYNLTPVEAFDKRATQICFDILTKNLAKYPPPNSLRTKDDLMVHYRVGGNDNNMFFAAIAARDVLSENVFAFLSEIETDFDPGSHDQSMQETLALSCERFLESKQISKKMTMSPALVVRKAPMDSRASTGMPPPRTTCLACLRPATSSDSISSGHLIFHLNCFACSRCGGQFAPSDGPPKIKRGKPYHMACYELHKQSFAENGSVSSASVMSGLPSPSLSSVSQRSSSKGVSTCERCKQRILNKCVKLDTRRWHEECFLCTLCDKSLLTGYMLVKQKPLCASCARTHKAKSAP